MEFVSDLAHKFPVPGGGSAAAWCGACAAALACKVTTVWASRSSGETRTGLLETRKRFIRLMEVFSSLVEEDARTYREFSRTRKEGTPEERERAAASSLEPPLAIMDRARQTLNAIAENASSCPSWLRADLLTAVELLAASFAGAQHIARSNLRFITDRTLNRQLARRMEEAAFAFDLLLQTVRESLAGSSS